MLYCYFIFKKNVCLIYVYIHIFFYNFYCIFIKLTVSDKNGIDVGESDEIPKKEDEITLEVDLRTKERKKRLLHFFINDKQQKIFFFNLPDYVRFGVCHFLFIIFLILMYFYISF